jgi:signal transduction histidine kinase
MDPTPDERLLACFQKALAHELPNQLIALQGLARLLEEEEAQRLSADGRDYLRRLAAAARRTHALVGALVEVGRLSRQDHRPERLDPAEVAAEALAEVRQLFPGQEVEYDGPHDAPVVTAPRAALRQALVQLLRYAAAAQGGRPLRVALRAGPAELRLAADTPPVPAGRLATLFEPFAAAAGTGLELFLARQLVEGWGGTVRAEPSAGKGIEFVISWPSTAAGPPGTTDDRPRTTDETP